MNMNWLDEIREDEARKFPQYNPESRKWIVFVVQDTELCVIRANNRHGFISCGWDDINEKIIICTWRDDCSGRHTIRNRQRVILMKAAQVMADSLNKEEK